MPNKAQVQEENIVKALYKKAMGYKLEEVVEEYGKDKENENNLILTKRKVALKNVPPDISAAKALLKILCSKTSNSLNELSDEELKKEKIKLLKILKELEKKDTVNGAKKDKNKI